MHLMPESEQKLSTGKKTIEAYSDMPIFNDLSQRLKTIHRTNKLNKYNQGDYYGEIFQKFKWRYNSSKSS